MEPGTEIGELEQLRKANQELTDANRRLREADLSKSQFVAMTAHQLRTPLSAIKWTLHMLMSGELGSVTPDQTHFLKKGCDSIERVITVVNDWLNADYIEANRDEYKFISVNLNELIDGVIFEFEGQLKDKKITLTVNRPPTPAIQVEVDPIKMSMVMENLIDNAIKYTPEGGTVTIELIEPKPDQPDPELEMIVRDSGIGIPSAEQEKIFSRFFRASNAAAVAAHGSGLGLFIVKDIIERHGGRTWFKSQEEQGSSFHIAIPLHQNKV